MQTDTTTQGFTISADGLTKRVRELLHEADVSRTTVKDESKSSLEIPVTAGVVGVLLAPWLAAGATAALASRCTIVVVGNSKPSEPLVASP